MRRTGKSQGSRLKPLSLIGKGLLIRGPVTMVEGFLRGTITEHGFCEMDNHILKDQGSGWYHVRQVLGEMGGSIETGRQRPRKGHLLS